MKILKRPNEHGIYGIDAIDINELDYGKRGRIALVDADLLDNGTRHPNIAVMKMSAYFKAEGCEVHLVEDYSELYENGDYSAALGYDGIYISKVFDFTAIDEGLLQLPNVVFGGTGFFFDHAPLLPQEIEHHMPDYHIYDSFIEHSTRSHKETYYMDYINFSIGFASKGCFRQCDFCVNKNKKKVEFHSHIKEWYDPSRKYIYLWDDNILGYPHWKDVFDELAEINKPFQFRQGMDIRLLTDEKAKVLAASKYYGDFIFAFDHIEDEPIIKEKLALWTKYCSRETKLYILSGFASQDEKEIESVFRRISVVISYGCLPYIMRHELYLTSPYKDLFVQIARWANQPQFLRNFSFREFCEANQRTVKTKGFVCTTMRAMRDFEEKFPEIAKKYFDMKFNQQPFVLEKKKQTEERKRLAREKKALAEEQKRIAREKKAALSEQKKAQQK